jgi:hypothetical protein
MSTYSEILERGIYFVLKDEPNLIAHLSLCLAEGLASLGIPIFANRNYWLTDSEHPSYLFRHDENVSPDDCAVCVVDISAQLTESAQALLQPALNSKAMRVILNNSDFELWLSEFYQFEFIFRTHMSDRHPLPDHYVPWAFGISNRIEAVTATQTEFTARKREVLVNFRSSGNQGVRIAMEYLLIPWLEKLLPINRQTEYGAEPESIDPESFQLWVKLQGRHHPQYYDRLKNAMICCSYGGNFTYFDHQPAIVRWDSWRFWESLAAGCVTIHLDLAKYGFLLPVMPENWKHYIGVDLENPKEVMERLRDEPEIMSQISMQGRQWALEHYSPVPTACYFLDRILGEELGTTSALVNFLSEV